MKTMKASVRTDGNTALPSLAFTTPTIKASRHQAVTSSMAAQVRASLPSGVLVMPWSDRIRASTGNAVIDIATPRNSMKCMKGTPAGARPLVQPGRQPDAEDKRQRDAGERDAYRSSQLTFQALRVELNSDQKHVKHDAQLREHSE